MNEATARALPSFPATLARVLTDTAPGPAGYMAALQG